MAAPPDTDADADKTPGVIKVTVNLPAEQVNFLKGIAAREQLSFTDALRRSINSERFFADQEASGKKILVEDQGQLREVIRK